MKTIGEINQLLTKEIYIATNGYLYHTHHAKMTDTSMMDMYCGEIARIVEILILYAPKELLLKFADHYSSPWRVQPRAMGLLMRYRDHDVNQKLLPWVMSGTSYIKKNGWAHSDANKIFFCHDWLKWPDDTSTSSFKMYYALMALADSVDIPVLFGQWDKMPQGWQLLKPAPEQDRLKNMRLYMDLVNDEYPEWGIPSYLTEANPKIMLSFLTWLMDKKDYLEACGWNEETAASRGAVFFNIGYKGGWEYEQLMYFLYFYSKPDMEAKLLEAAKQVKERNWDLFLDRILLRGLRTFPRVIEYLYENAKLSSGISRLSIMKDLIDEKQILSFSWLLEHKFANTKPTVNRLREYALDQNATEFLAAIMEYKNKTEDPVKELEKKQKREMALLNAKPDSALMLKQLYNWRSNPDGTLSITRYKGKFKEHIIIPAKIGRSYVSSIESNAFNPGVRKPKESGHRLKQVTFPEGIKYIKTDAFAGCRFVDRVDLPSTLEWISGTAFNTILPIHYYFNGDHLKVCIDGKSILSTWVFPSSPFIHMPKDVKNPRYSLITPKMDQAIVCDYDPAEKNEEDCQ